MVTAICAGPYCRFAGPRCLTDYGVALSADGRREHLYQPGAAMRSPPMRHTNPASCHSVMTSTTRLANKVAVVTAAGQGIGRATALAFASAGAHVIATDISAPALGQYGGIANIETALLDVTDSAAISEFALRVGHDHGGCAVLFNCAGVVHTGTVLSTSEDEFDFSLTLNVKSMYRMIRALLPGMLERALQHGGGSIINMASVASSIKGAPNRFVYGTTKAAVIGLTKSVAADFVTQGIRCNAICPGTVDSPSWRARVDEAADPVQARADFVARQPMGRIGTAQEVAHLAVYLAADESAFTTGAVHIIDGGWSA